MLYKNAARLALAVLSLTFLMASSCGPDDEKGTARKDFGAGANREKGVEVLNPYSLDLPFYFSFGPLPYGKVFAHTFELRNIEDRAITIKRWEPACSCSRIKSMYTWKGEEIEQGTIDGNISKRGDMLRVEPGQRFSIEILVDTKRVTPNAHKLAVLRVVTDSEVDPYLAFEINFLPERLFEQASPSLKLGDIPLGGGIGNTMQVWSRVSMGEARLIDVLSTTPGLQAELELIPDHVSNWNLTVTAIGQEKRGPLRGAVVLRTTDIDGLGDAGRLEIPVEGRVVPPIMMYPSNLSFGRIAQGKGGRLTAGVNGLAPGHKIAIKQAHLTGPSAEFLTVELERIATDTFGKSVRIDVHIHCDKDTPPGEIKAELTLDLVDEFDPTIVRTIHGLVE